MPQIGEQVFYKNGETGYPQKGYIVGETKRSWYMHHAPDPWWARERDSEKMRLHGTRYEKKALIFVTAEDYALSLWAHENRNSIQSQIWRITPEQLKQVAVIIGYEKKIA